MKSKVGSPNRRSGALGGQLVDCCSIDEVQETVTRYRRLLGEAACGVLDGDDMRCAEDSEQQRTAVGVVQYTDGQRRRCGRVEGESEPRA